MTKLEELREAGKEARRNAEPVDIFPEELDALLDVVDEARHHACPLVLAGSGSHTPQPIYALSPHLESSDEGTSYCRMCAALARLDEGETDG